MYKIDLTKEYNIFPTCSFTLDERMYAVIADQSYYNYIGSNINYKFEKIIYEDDVFTFKEFFSRCEKDSSVVIRVMAGDNVYRYVVIEMIATTSTLEGNRYCELKMHDVLKGIDEYESYLDKIKKYRGIINQIDDIIFEYDYATCDIKTYRYVNNHSDIIERKNLDEWIADQINNDFIDEQYIERFKTLPEIIKSGMENFSMVLKTSMLSKGERVDTLKLSGQCIYDGTHPKLYVGIICEISIRLGASNSVTFDIGDADKDPGTGVLNKRAVTKKIVETLDRYNKDGVNANVYLAIFDIDNFKFANDSFGHMFGDEVIKAMARNTSRALGPDDIFGRTGGDEFVALLTGYDELSLRNFVRTVRNSIKVELGTKNKNYYFSLSIGISTYKKDGIDYNNLFNIADASLYIAKEKGKDRFIIYREELHKEFLQKFKESKIVKEENCSMALDRLENKNSLDQTINWMLRLEHDKFKAINSVLSEIIKEYEIDGITVFAGKKYKNIIAVGNYIKPAKDLGFLNSEKYVDFFNDEKINRVSTTAHIDPDYSEMCEIINDNLITSLVQIKVNDNNETEYIVEFDVNGDNKKKWNNDDLEAFYMLAKTIGDILN